MAKSGREDMYKILFMMGAAFLFQGCTYAISPDLAARADKTIPFNQLEDNPGLYQGTLVILGGTIASLVIIENSTLIEVVQKPLDHWGKPQRTGRAGGRFIVQHAGYLNAQLFATGRQVTVAALVAGFRRKSLSDDTELYPVVLSKELKLWPRERAAWSRPEYLDPLYDPYTSPLQY